MKKCKGCGIILQDQDNSKIGYVKSLDQEYCQRCFRLTHYGDTSMLSNNLVSNSATLEIYNRYKDEVFALIIDVMDLFSIDSDNLLETFKDYKTILIVNKYDLLPSNISEYKIDKLLNDMLNNYAKKYPKILSALITHYKDSHFNDMFYDLIDELNIKTIVFAGRSNAGKSTLINKIMHSDELTTSLYPSTTLSDNIIEFDGYRFIDTPGLIDFDNYSSYLDDEAYKKVMIRNTIKPKVFQFDSAQSYFYEGLLKVDVMPEDKATITFYINNNIEIHRTKYNNADKYYNNHFKEFSLKTDILKKHSYNIDKSQLFVIKGLGLIKIYGKAKCAISLNENVQIYLSQENL